MDMSRTAKFTLTGGPIEATDRTLRALSRQVYYHYDPEFKEIFADTTLMLKKVFQTKQDIIIMQGEALLGLEAAAACCFQPGDKVLNLVSGAFGHEYAWYISLYGAEPVEIRVPYNEIIDPADVEKVLKANPDIKFLAVVHSETPSGTLNPVQDICPIAKKYGVITIIDAVSSMGGVDIRPDEWGFDICVVGPQKCLSSTPGLAIISVSDEAWEVMRKKDPPVRFSYLSMLDFKDIYLETGQFPYTIFTNEVVALHETLKQIIEGGLERAWQRHTLAAEVCRAGVKGMGLEIWPARDEICTPCVTAIKTPEGIDDAVLRNHMYRKYGVLISGGFKDLMGKLFRIGHMGKTADPMYVMVALSALEKTLQDLGYPIKLGSGVTAALEAF
ncbi:MAG: alanine--glyoxylate aminotransferase family protein [Anaerolineales bacterium]|nr:alanine--glyoxylate aminotransferase family protein [Anaerolineales bacterium]